MIPRYTRPEVGLISSEQGRFERWLEVELAASDTLAETGIVPREAAARVKHDVIAFTLT